MFCSEPELSKILFGSKKGCFETPHHKNKPSSDHDCPELMPLSYKPRNVDMNLLNNSDPKIHPVKLIGKSWELNCLSLIKPKMSVYFIT